MDNQACPLSRVNSVYIAALTASASWFASSVTWVTSQLSEFALLLAILAFEHEIISFQASNVIQLATLLSFILSAYLVVLRYPTPIAVSDDLRRD